MPPTRSSPVCSSRTTTAHPDEVQRRRLYRLPAARAAQAGRPGSMAARSSSTPGKPPATSNQPQARSTARQGDHPVSGPRPAVASRRPAGPLRRRDPPTRGACLLMCTDTSLDAIDIIRLYGLRFKIEHTFKQAVRQISSFTYHFWMSNMKPLRRNSGNQHLHHHLARVHQRRQKRKLHAYHVFIQAGIICQGLLQYLAVAHPRLVWNSFGSWLRTIRPGIPPSELVVAITLLQPPRISLEYSPKLHLHEIRHRTTGHQQNAGLPPRRLIPNSSQTGLRGSEIGDGYGGKSRRVGAGQQAGRDCRYDRPSPAAARPISR